MTAPHLTHVKDIDLVQEVRLEVAKTGGLQPLSPMHRASVDDVTTAEVALERTYALLLHVLDGAADVEEDVVVGHPVVDALLSLRDDPRLNRRQFGQGRFAPVIDRLPAPVVRVDISDALATYVKQVVGNQLWIAKTPFTHQPLGAHTSAQRALLLIEMMRAKGVLPLDARP